MTLVPIDLEIKRAIELKFKQDNPAVTYYYYTKWRLGLSLLDDIGPQRFVVGRAVNSYFWIYCIKIETR